MFHFELIYVYDERYRSKLISFVYGHTVFPVILKKLSILHCIAFFTFV